MKKRKAGRKTTRKPARRMGRPPGKRGRCGVCRRLGHNARTCKPRRKKG